MSPDFIYKIGETVIVVDGSSPEAKTTTIEGHKIVQLRRARTEESGYLWEMERIQTIVLKNILIYDHVDLSCLRWILNSRVIVDLSKSDISCDIAEGLNDLLSQLVKDKVKVATGSRWYPPTLGGISGYGLSMSIEMLGNQLGFNQKT